ncbi:serine hydroxymethyltransferase [Holotrichia oblita]|nr:serine hydroxymethyltransferase [Holotrichia oblita]
MIPRIDKLIKKEQLRQCGKINLIASENIASPAVMRAAGSVLTNKYAEGYPGARYYGGCEVVDEIENYARNLAKQLFNAQHANVQPHCGSSANMAAYMAVLKPGDTILAMNLDAGGHLTHGAKVSFSGALYNFVHYGLDEKGILDYKGIETLAKKHKPKLIVAGGSAYSLIIDFDRIAKIAKSVKALFMVDMAHFAGLVAAELYPNPCEFADIVTSTTHKTLRGPRGGIILCKAEYAKAIDKAVMPGIQGGPLMHIIAAKAVCFEEAIRPDFRLYQQNVLNNTRYLCEGLKEAGIKIVSGGTQTHLFLIDLGSNGKSGAQVQKELDEKYNVVVNKNKIQGDTRSAMETSGIRIGLPFITNFRRLDKNALDELCDIIAAVVLNKPEPVRVRVLNKIFR